MAAVGPGQVPPASSAQPAPPAQLAAGQTAVVVDLADALARLEAGTVIRAIAVARAAGGVVELATDLGPISLRVALPLPPGTSVMVQLLPDTGGTLRAVIVAGDKPVADPATVVARPLPPPVPALPLPALQPGAVVPAQVLHSLSPPSPAGAGPPTATVSGSPPPQPVPASPPAPSAPSVPVATTAVPSSVSTLPAGAGALPGAMLPPGLALNIRILGVTPAPAAAVASFKPPAPSSPSQPAGAVPRAAAYSAPPGGPVVLSPGPPAPAGTGPGAGPQTPARGPEGGAVSAARPGPAPPAPATVATAPAPGFVAAPTTPAVGPEAASRPVAAPTPVPVPSARPAASANAGAKAGPPAPAHGATVPRAAAFAPAPAAAPTPAPVIGEAGELPWRTGDGGNRVAPRAGYPTPRPDASAAARLMGRPLTGHVSFPPAAGGAIINTPVGILAVTGSGAPGPGGSISFEIVESGGSGLAPAASRATPLLGLFRGWPALDEALAVLRQSDPGAAAELLDQRIAQPGPRLAASMLFFISALRAGNFQNWLGGRAAELLSRVGRGDLAARLSDEFGQLGRLGGESAAGEWRGYLIPLHDGGQLNQIRMFLRDSEDEDEGDDAVGGGRRFLLDFELSRMGQMQLDGLVQGRRFNLIVRTSVNLPDNVRREIAQIFADGCACTGIAGEVAFAPAGDLAVLPVARGVVDTDIVTG